MGERPLPGRRKARRLRPGISKHLGNRWEDGSTPMWDSLRHLSGFFEGQSPPEAVNAWTRGGVKTCRRMHKNNEVAAPWMIEGV